MPAGLGVFLGVLGAAVVSMVAYALAGRRPDADAARKGSTFLMGLGDFLVHWLMWVLGPAERLFLRWGWTPDAFNFLGLGFGLLSGLLIASGRLELGGWAIALGGIADIFDGRIARARNLGSEYGKFIDSTLDRFVEVFVFLGFVYYLRAHPLGPLLAAAAITGSLLVSYARARGESVGVLCKEGLMQRAERLVLTFLVCLLDPPLTARMGRPPGTAVVWVLALIAAGTFATAVQRTVWISQRLRGGGGTGPGPGV
jgi:CDP-diacylglycerol--glycerol-3-phosphate 3-phosphatidyltransferase